MEVSAVTWAKVREATEVELLPEQSWPSEQPEPMKLVEPGGQLMPAAWEHWPEQAEVVRPVEAP